MLHPPSRPKSVVNDKKTEFNFELKRVQPVTGSIKVTSEPDGAKIFINGVDTGKQTPYTFNDKPVGTYEVYVTKTGYVTPATQTKAVVNDKKTEFNFELKRVQPVTGSIKVTSAPAGATIFLDGKNTGKITPDTLTNVPVGNHEVYVTRSGYITPVATMVNVINKEMANSPLYFKK